MLRREMDGLLKTTSCEDDEEERKETEKMYEEKIERIRAVFERARDKENQRRPNPPDWAIDDISFQVMVDPVMVGFSFPLPLTPSLTQVSWVGWW